MHDIMELQMKVPSRNKLDRQHWAVKSKNKQIWALLIRNQMRLRKIRKTKEKEKFTVSILCYKKDRLYDTDNVWGGCKQLLDAMVSEDFIYDDAPEYLDLKVQQIKAKESHTMVIRKS